MRIEVTIRDAIEADRQAVVTVAVRAFADVRREHSGEVLTRTWADWEANTLQAVCLNTTLIAEVAGEPVGFATYELDDRSRIGTVSDNAVLPEYRGRGIGGLLLAGVLKRMAEAGMEFAQVETGLDSPYAPARRMYERHGFQPLHRSIGLVKELQRELG